MRREIGKEGTMLLSRMYARQINDRYINSYFYHGDGDCPLLFKNSPIARFAMSYKEVGKDILLPKVLDEMPYIQFFCEREGKNSRKFKLKTAKQVISAYESIKKYGYCKKPFSIRDAIHVKKGFYSATYGDDSEGYTFVRRNHRAASCIALGYDKVPCLFYKEKGRRLWRM